MRNGSGPRLYVEEELGIGREVTLSADQAHYVRNVMRLSDGDEIALFNGHDGEWTGRLVSLGRKKARVSLERESRRQRAEPDIRLLFAPVKRAPLDFMVQKSVELGVSRLCPVLTERTDVSRVNLARMRSTVIEAAEQCRRLTLPHIAEPASLTKTLTGWPADRPLLVCAEIGPIRPIVKVLADFKGAARGTISGMAILVGPEGGFTTSELDGLRKLPFVTATGLGPRILRAETAAVAALACWQSTLGDWQSDRN
ncbi:MAG: 16S rRNA (uracil(1498)-N(3))-methyltransferase [Pseudomonadota bacterium]